MFDQIRSRVGADSGGGVETKSIAMSRYYNDLTKRGLLRSNSSWSIDRAIVEGYERVIWVFKSVNTIASDSASLPYRLREGDAEVDDHPLYRVLNKKANPLESGKVLRKRLSSQILLSEHGAFVHKVMSNGGTVKQLFLLPPDRMQIIPNDDGGIEGYQLTKRLGGYKFFEPDEVLWFREPHPTDPYAAVSPLKAMGLSVELDHYARLYNVSFMQNDGRPGGVLAVRDTAGGTDISPTKMDRIEKRFGKGPVEAGKLSVIAGELSYVDLATRPRDMQYGQTSANSKMELLGGFGMSEVVLGTAAGRTFDNADAELYNYWTRTIPAHNDILLDGFEECSDDDQEGYFDTSKVEVLERAARRTREEARTEVKEGLRSIFSYAQLAGYGDQIEDTIYTRSIYLANGKTPIPVRSEDVQGLGLDTGAGGTGEQPPALAAAAEEAGGIDTAALGTAAEPGAPAAPDDPADTAGIDMAALGQKGLVVIDGGARPKVDLVYAVSRKSSPAEPWADDEDGEHAQAALEAELTTVLSNLAERWIDKTAARVASPRQRKGTRHFVPEYAEDTRVGTKALDAAKAVDEQQWQEEAEEQTHPIVEAAAIAAAVALLTGMDVTPPTGQSVREWAAELVRETVGDVVRLIARSAVRQALLLVDLISLGDQQGDDIETITGTVKGHLTRLRNWAQGVSVQASTGTINGSREAAADAANDEDETLMIRREWITKRDTRVRDSHRRADRQARDLREPFIVGESLLRFPGDPLAPIHETANCRCRLRYRHRRSGRFVNLPEALLGG